MGQAEVGYGSDLRTVNWQRLKQDLAADSFDNGRSPAQLERSFANSFARVFARCDGAVVGTARALSDGVCNAYVVDVWTHSRYRRRGIATTMMDRLLTRLSGQHVYLFTDDAVSFYHRLGFRVQGVGMSNVVGEWLKTRGRLMTLQTDGAVAGWRSCMAAACAACVTAEPLSLAALRGARWRPSSPQATPYRSRSGRRIWTGFKTCRWCSGSPRISSSLQARFHRRG